jgi:hypothetical protein
MSARTIARWLLVLAGLFDGVLGAAFLSAAPQVFSFCAIPAPNHWGYVHFASALLMIFALMFFAAAVYPAGNRNLVAYGMLLKVAFVGTVLYHWMHGDVPGVFKLFLVLDAAWFFILGWIFFAVRPANEKFASGSSAAPPIVGRSV